jgi:glycine betaine/proline transport system substrate-binding protein
MPKLCHALQNLGRDSPMRLMTIATWACLSGTAFASDPESCQTVRMSDLGWTDIMLTNTSAAVVLEALGYSPTQTILGLDVTYVSMQEGEIDVFLGNWRPFQNEQYKPFFDSGAVQELGQNLTGAKYTLAVPTYVADGGVTSFADLATHADKFDRKIYAIEPGSNQPLLDMVAAGRHGLGDWTIVESSEAAMLAQVENSVADQEWVAFLGWEPHPMNLTYDMTYLSGGDVEFGPDFGGATVHTLARGGWAAECPNAARFFTQLAFDLDYENQGMQKIMGEGMDGAEAAKAMMTARPELLAAWLNGVTTLSGEPGLAAVQAMLAP